MNAPAEANVAQTPAASRGRGRGRGGGPAPRGKATQGRVSVPKAQNAKIGPNRLLEVEWVKDSILKGNCFVLFAGSGQPGDQQWTFHHPIGETPLDARDWVATPTRDISFLLQRRESEALVAWKRQSELAKRHAVLRLQVGRRLAEDGQTEVWSFQGAPAIQPTIQSCMTAAKAAGANESEWLSYADQAVRVAEQSFKEALRTQPIPAEWIGANPKPHHETMGGPLGDHPQKAISFLKGYSVAAANVAEQSFKEALRTQPIPEEWIGANPKPHYETMGGPLGDHPQKAISFLKGYSVAAAKDKVIRVAIGLDQTDEDSEPPSDPESDAEEATPVVSKPVVSIERKPMTTPTHSREMSQGSAVSSLSKGKKT
uniref:Uncharacterized protein n=1 Tax=Exserohilum turcicum narnavirus 1 TaxID=3229034 RepID=A0AAU7YDF0_9VIRU